MTIAAGFVCSDGVLLASDTLYSGTNQNAQGPKFWHSRWGEIDVVFGGSGPVAGLRRARDEIKRRAHPTDEPFDVLQGIEESLTAVHKTLNPTDVWENKIHSLVGLRRKERCLLYHNDGGSLMLSAVDQSWQCVGAPHPLGDYFAKSLFRENMTIEWALLVAAHMVKQTYCSGWAGGSTHLWVMPSIGVIERIDNKQRIKGYESYLADIDGAMQCVLPDKSVNTATAKYRAQRLSEEIRALQKNVVLMVEPGQIIISGQVPGVIVTPTPPQKPESEGGQ